MHHVLGITMGVISLFEKLDRGGDLSTVGRTQ